MFASSQFDGDISNWDVGNVINILYMFSESKFNGDISDWNLNLIIDVDLQRVLENSYLVKNRKDADMLMSQINMMSKNKTSLL